MRVTDRTPRPRSLTVARTQGVLNDCPTRHPARPRRSWSRTSVARGSAKDGLRGLGLVSQIGVGAAVLRDDLLLEAKRLSARLHHVLGQGVTRPFSRLSDTTHNNLTRSPGLLAAWFCCDGLNKKAPAMAPFWWIAPPSGLALAFYVRARRWTRSPWLSHRH